MLIEPQIPNNTGNVGRTCVATNSRLHLVEPLGFEISDSRVKRAGLDYWQDLDLKIHSSFDSIFEEVEDKKRMFFFSARAKNSFYKTTLQQGDWLLFGREADGLPRILKSQFENQLVKIPFPGNVRSFNLSNAVAMALGEGIRQLQT